MFVNFARKGPGINLKGEWKWVQKITERTTNAEYRPACSSKHKLDMVEFSLAMLKQQISGLKATDQGFDISGTQICKGYILKISATSSFLINLIDQRPSISLIERWMGEYQISARKVALLNCLLAAWVTPVLLHWSTCRLEAEHKASGPGVRPAPCFRQNARFCSPPDQSHSYKVVTTKVLPATF